MKRSEKIRLTAVLAVLALLTVVCANAGSDPAAQITAALSEFSGKVQVMKASEGEFRAPTPDVILEANDQVLTGEDGRARIDISDGTIIRLSPLSNFVLTSVDSTDEGTLTKLQLNIGRLWIILKGGVVEVDTPSGLASVRGSYLHVWVDPLTDETNVTCLEGQCTLGNDQGTVSLVAGQTAQIKGLGQAPEAGKMTHEDVNEWLAANPEATLVVLPLTATVAAGQDQPLPEVKTNTPTPTNTIGPSPTAGPSNTPTLTLIAANCGPPDGWVLHTVRPGETLETLSLLYRVSEADLRNANCRGEMDFVVAGEKLYVPNVATSTPTNTPTLTPKPSATVSGGGSGSTVIPTNAPTTMSGPVGPDNVTIATVSACPNPYKIKVVDANGVEEVKMIYTFDGSIPKRDTAISAGKFVLLPYIDLDVYGISGQVIDTTGVTAPVHVRFRFVAKDKLGNITYFPVNDAFDLTDKVNCSGNTPATFSSPSGPTSIPDSLSCSQTFKVDVVDPDGISVVKLLYNVDGVTPTWSVSVGAGDYYTMTKTGTKTYEFTGVIDSSVGTTDTVKYRFAVQDSKGKVTESAVYSYTDAFDCGKTTWLTPPSLVDPITSLGQCSQLYEIQVSDANGISEVKVYYTIVDNLSLVPDENGYFVLPKTLGDQFSGTYSWSQIIDLDAGGFSTGSIVYYEFKAKDTLGNWTSMYTGSFADDYVCP